MSVRYDEKGKFFTEVVSKEPVKVIIQTLLHQIRGDIFKRPDDRIKDAINEEEKFLAVTDLTVNDSRGREIYRSDFLLVNLDQIVWIIPMEENQGVR